MSGINFNIQIVELQNKKKMVRQCFQLTFALYHHGDSLNYRKRCLPSKFTKRLSAYDVVTTCNKLEQRQNKVLKRYKRSDL